MEELVVDFWGDFACFSRPEAKVERLTYPLPTPSAARGMLSAVYAKPQEFYWQVLAIEILNPLCYICFKRNEVKDKIPARSSSQGTELTVKEPLLADGTKDMLGTDQRGRTQRQTVALQNVRYRIHARICPHPGFPGSESRLYDQALRRIRHGKCFYQPSLGLKEFVAYFSEGAGAPAPIDLDLDLGYMLYDVFDLHSSETGREGAPYVTLFHSRIEKGVMLVPPFDSQLVLKPEERRC